MDKADRQKLLLSLQHIRDHPLIKIQLWNEADHGGLRKEIGIGVKNTLFYYNGDYVKIYYDLKSLEETFTRIIEISTDKKIISWEKKIKRAIKKMAPYLYNKKSIKTKKELLEFYKNYKIYWPIMAIFFVIPNVESLDESIKKRILDLRKQSQKLSDSFGDVFRKGILSTSKKIKKGEENFVLLNEFLNKEKINKKELNKRKKSYIFYEGKIYVGQELRSLITEKRIVFEDKKPLKKQKEIIEGTVSYPGRVTGSAKIVMTSKNLKKIKKGNIIISPMTTPSYIPSLRNIKAIVTDEGGVTCHASIISRELKIPCIIGTKIASKLLKDGDLVEVDANKGIVKKL